MGLFKPAWMSSNYQKAEESVNAIGDNNELLKVSEEAKLYVIQMMALRKIDDINILTTVAKFNGHSEKRKVAAGKLNDRAVLEYIVQNDSEDDVREAARERLKRIGYPIFYSPYSEDAKSEKNLLEIAKTNPSWEARRDALVTLWAELVVGDETEDNEALKEALEEIALNDESWKVRAEATRCICDENVLAQIAKTDEYYEVQSVAIWGISDKEILYELANLVKSDGGRVVALHKAKTGQNRDYDDTDLAQVFH